MKSTSSPPGWASLRGRPRSAAAAGLACLALGLAACSDELPPSGNPPPAQTSSTAPVESIGIPANPLVLVEPGPSGGQPTFEQIGSADTTVATSSLDGGEILVASAAEAGDGGPAMRFPSYVKDESAPYPRSVVLVRNQGTTDQFDPGSGSFTVGVDFDIDTLSTGREDDNGNNLIQRGLSSDDSLFKLEVDANMRPACTVRGSEGTNILRSTARVLPGIWYRVRCNRDGNTLKIEVGRVLSDGTVLPSTQSQTMPIGVVTAGDASIPISIGGKVAHDGTMVNSASDQFNGLLRNPFLKLPG